MIDDVCLIIPAFNPDEDLFLNFIDQATKNFSNIIVINDGSDEKYNGIFETIQKEYSKICMLKHSVNLGKGRALKTSFNYYLNAFSSCIGIVQADCDGQHNIDDVVKCAKALKENKESLILGVRDFNGKDVPAKSKYGNKITRNIFKLFIGINIKDTQTGLRAIGNDLIKKFICTKGERYEYETNILIDCKENNISIKEIPIKTIYIEKNQTSKFNPLKDSFIIYKLFAKYIFSALSAFIIDIIMFNIFVKLLMNVNIDNKIIYATIVARIISSLYNFKVNSKIVFKNLNKNSFIKYVILVLTQMLVSAFSVEFLTKISSINVIVIKILVDLVLFITNFVIQREFIFNKKN